MVHEEITTVMSKGSDKKFSFLTNVKIDEVEKVWKKAIGSVENENSCQAQNVEKSNFGIKSVGKELDSKIDNNLEIDKVENKCIDTITNDNSTHSASLAAQAQQIICKNEEKDNYEHFFLNMPADRSGSRPYQALINFQENTISVDKKDNKLENTGKVTEKKN